MENNFKFKGEKFERNLSFLETAKILGTSNVKILELLRQKEILFRTNGRNIPYDKYLDKQWFEVTYAEIIRENFHGVVPIVKITKKGFHEIEKILLKESSFIKTHNQRTFWKTIKYKIVERMKSEGIRINDFDNWLFQNAITHTDSGEDVFTIFTFINSKRINLVRYNLKNKKILENEG